LLIFYDTQVPFLKQCLQAVLILLCQYSILGRLKNKIVNSIDGREEYRLKYGAIHLKEEDL